MCNKACPMYLTLRLILEYLTYLFILLLVSLLGGITYISIDSVLPIPITYKCIGSRGLLESIYLAELCNLQQLLRYRDVNLEMVLD